MADRIDIIFRGIDINKMTGLEVGPLATPMVARKPGRKIFYADYTSQDVLRQNSKSDPNVNIDNIPEIDFIIKDLPDSLGVTFDYIVASHVGEHIPDFVGWIHTLLGWLKPGGKIVLALPDSRYMFDCYRPMSTSGQMLEAFLQKRKSPSVSSIYDGVSKSVDADPWHLWESLEPSTPYKPYFTKANALNLAKRAHETGEYRDCHCWVFSPEHFKSMIDELSEIGIAKFKIARIEPTEKYKIEFFVEIVASQ